MEKKPNYIGLISLGILGLIILAAVFSKFGARLTFENGPQPSPTSIPRATPSATPAPTIQQTTPETPPLPQATPSPTIDPEQAKQMGQRLKQSLDEFLSKEAKAFSRERGGAGREKSFYQDIDNDGYEDAIFLYWAGINESDSFNNGLVVFKNNGSEYVYVTHAVISGSDFVIKNTTIKNNTIRVSGLYYEEMGEEGEPLIKTYIFRNNRLELLR